MEATISNGVEKGDQNTRYFHCRANQRNKRNYILGWEDEAGSWVEDDSSMGNLVESYFQDMFTSSTLPGFDEILNGMQLAISEDMNVALDHEFQAEEVKQALKQMAPLTTPGPDGMSPIFYVFLAYCG